jgi:thiol-disulfide isomerase/thioredoxin
MVKMLIRRFVLTGAAIAVLTSSCTLFGHRDEPSPTVAPSTTADLLPTTNDALPTMSIEGFRTMLGQLEGSPVVVNVWASWCEPCKREIPLLAAAAKDHPGVRFVGVNTLDSRDGAEAFITDQAIPYPSVFDPEGAIITDLDAIGPPVTVFYAADGTRVASIVGEISQETLDEQLAAITA